MALYILLLEHHHDLEEIIVGRARHSSVGKSVGGHTYCAMVRIHVSRV